MIVVRLSGGMGNQMFQYAAAKNLATINNVELVLDISDIQKQTESDVYTKRKFILNAFKIKASVIQNNECDYVYNNPTSFFQKVLSFIKKKVRPYNYYFDYSLSYRPDFFNLGKNAYLEGYFQSEKYFLPIKQQLISEFFTDAYQINNEISDKIKGSESVGIHFRRGDFSDKMAVNQRHGTCSVKYYEESIELIKKKIPQLLSFFVFSDNIKWAKDQLKNIQGDFTFIENEGADATVKDFTLMKLCKHQIIANSTFSWWAAWLNQNTNKVVIAPEMWLSDTNIDTSDVIPPAWIKL